MRHKTQSGWAVLRILGRIYAVLGGVVLLAGMLIGTLVQHLSGAILMMVGAPFLVIGLVLLLVDFFLEKRRKRLVETGRFIWAEIVECGCNNHVSYHNGVHPYRLAACYTAPDGVRHLFRSQDLQPYAGLKDLMGKNVKVYHDENFRHYYVDVQPLLENYVIH